MAKKKDAPPAEKKQRKVPSTAYSTENPSPHAFQPGQSGCPGGKPNQYRALARALRASGAGRATDAECDALGLPRGSSKLQVSAERVMWTMRKGKTSEQLQAVEVYARLCGEYAATKLQLGFDPDFDGEGENAGPPRLIVEFVTSQHDLEQERLTGRLIDAPPLSDRDPDPAAAAAQAERNHAPQPEREPEPKPQPSKPEAPRFGNVIKPLIPRSWQI
jgi:hypothetical protein